MRLTIELPDYQKASPEQRAQIAVARIRAIQQRSKPDPDGLTVLDYIHQSRRG
ncbi:MAG: hypothetical protein JST93_14685 [Acidobacteria bacterium]|nr:hypothetical protein [Acidobacteriota bacterium]